MKLQNKFNSIEKYHDFLAEVEKKINLDISDDDESSYVEDFVEIEFGNKWFEVDYESVRTSPYVHANYSNYPPEPPIPAEYEQRITGVRCYDVDWELEYEIKEIIEL